MSAEPASDVVIGVRDACKTFTVPSEASHTLKERVLHPLRTSATNSFAALDNVSFNVRRGEFFGIVGRNGSGKSTMLKCLAGIYGLDHGSIVVDGRMSTFIELGVGFNPDLAARDNVVMNGIMLGLTPKQARKRYDEVIRFAELEDHQELKLKNYSSGMHVRLAFSVAIQVRADILLIDEVLAVGDAAFQQKCFDVLHQMRADGRTVLFVTHDMGSVVRLCDRAMLLEHGVTQIIDEPDMVANRYMELNFQREDPSDAMPGSELPAPNVEVSAGEAPVRVARCHIENADGVRTSSCSQGQKSTFVIALRFLTKVYGPAFTVLFLNENHDVMLVATTAYAEAGKQHYAFGDLATVRVVLDPRFRPGRYACAVIVGHQGTAGTSLTRYDDILSFVVSGPYATGGLTDVSHEIAVDRAADSRAASAQPT